MKDITRIHIAKVPYNIELAAKKELEKYIAALEAYMNDDELLEDVEIRMTELLLERNVKEDDVITSKDVEYVRELLGEPKDFMADEAVLDVDAALLEPESKRKLYRSIDTAVLGGVLSGIAQYTKVNALWVRLAFVVLLLISFGTFALIYALLWLIVPPARTAAEKLQLAGRPVTLASIREMNALNVDDEVARRGRIQKRVATMTLGILSVIGALSVVTGLVVVLGIVPVGIDSSVFALGETYRLPILMAAGAGVLLTVLFVLIAIAGFTQKFNKRIWISGIVIIVLGLGLFGASLTTASYQQRQQADAIIRDTIETKIPLPEGFANVKTLKVDIPYVANVNYIVDDKATSITQRSLKGSTPVNVSVVDGTLTVSLGGSYNISRYADNTVAIYGPRLDGIIVTNGYATYNAASQDTLKAEVYNAASLHLIGSRIDTLTAKTDGSAQLSAEDAAVKSVKASINGQSTIGLGNIKSLEVTTPEVCASNQAAQLTIENIVSATYKNNGSDISAISTQSPCLNVEFTGNQNGEGVYSD